MGTVRFAFRTACARASIFFFQAEGGIRDHCVTGVRTCALPICRPAAFTGRYAGGEPDVSHLGRRTGDPVLATTDPVDAAAAAAAEAAKNPNMALPGGASVDRSEERRVGKERRRQRDREQSQRTG